MTGTNHDGRQVPLTGADRIDALTYGTRFAGGAFTYGFSRSAENYGDSYSLPGGGRPGELDTFSPVTAGIKIAVRFAMEGGRVEASQGFGVEGFTNIRLNEIAAPASDFFGAHYRFGQSALSRYNEIAYANPAGTWPNDRAGDVWFRAGEFGDVQAGNLNWYVALHETGHALGMKHTFQTFTMPNGDFHPVLPRRWDSMEFTVMTYNSYAGENASSLGGNGRFDYAQSWMMLDIRALQHMFGADYTVNAGDTVYSWRPGQGDTRVDGQIAIDGGGDTIFATIWDGGGSDCYDLSAYQATVRIDLRAGCASTFAQDQLASLGSGRFAGGNIYNAMTVGGDLRSLIEHAIGGAANDRLIGNEKANLLRGGAGADRFEGLRGNDMYQGGAGADRFVFNRANDGRDIVVDFNPDQPGELIWLRGGSAFTSFAQVSRALVQVGDDVELRDRDGDVLVLRGVDLADLGADDFLF